MKTIEAEEEIITLTALGLTDAQARVFRYLYLFSMRSGYQPSYRDFSVYFGWSSPTALNSFLVALEKKGWIRMNEERARAIMILRNLDGSPFRGFRPPGEGTGQGQGGG